MQISILEVATQLIKYNNDLYTKYLFKHSNKDNMS